MAGKEAAPKSRWLDTLRELRHRIVGNMLLECVKCGRRNWHRTPRETVLFMCWECNPAGRICRYLRGYNGWFSTIRARFERFADLESD